MSVITGYRKLSEPELFAVHALKHIGNTFLDNLKQLVESLSASGYEVDQRWLAIGKTDLQTAVMALTRSITKPEGI